MTRTIETPVLIVGGGPVGLALALDLAWRGQACMLIEKTDGTVRYSKMGSVAVRTMEFCRRWGITDRVWNAGFPVDYPLSQVFCTSLAGHLIAATHYPSARDQVLGPESPEKYLRVPQLWFDPMLADCVRQRDTVDLRYRCELTGLTQHDDHVAAEVRDANGETFTIAAQYVVGCDGPGSVTRRALGLSLEGEPVLSYSNGIYLRLPDVRNHHDKPIAERYVLIGEEGNWGSLTTVDGDGRWRLTVHGRRDRADDAFDAEWWVRRCVGSDAIPFEITDVLPWRRGQVVAQRYRDRRVFLAGDAAHIMAPNGGYGMNTGIADAVDLGWKLDAVLAGWGGDILLESYDTERRPIGRRNVDIAASNFSNSRPQVDTRLLFDDTAAGDAWRRGLGRHLEEATKAQWERLGVLMGHRYEGSPICIPDGTPAPPDDRVLYVPTARPSHRAPHAWIAKDRSVLDLFGRGFTLLRFGADAPDPAPLVAAAEARGVPLDVHAIDAPAIAELYGRKLVLVRPDGHSAWRGDAIDADPDWIIGVVSGVTRQARAQAAA